jgi:hypothetical protein
VTKIKFVANYDSDINIYNSIINCFGYDDILTFEENYSYLGVINGYEPKKIKTPRENNFGFLQEPLDNINYDRNLHFYCKNIFCQSKDAFKTNIIQDALCMFYSGHTYYDKKKFDNLDFQKNKKLCVIVSGLTHPNNPNWINHNYQKRIKLIQQIIDSDLEIDIYGRNLNLTDSRYKGSPINKHEVLKEYKYSIAIENVCEENYVSEKFFDCILNNVVPLYYGSQNIDDIFNSECHEKIDIDSKNIIEDIKNICSNDTKKYQNAIILAKQKYFANFNPLKKIKEFINL